MNTQIQDRAAYNASQNPFNRELTVPCVLFCAILFMILGVLPVTPDRIVGLYRPIFIFFSVFSVFRCYPLHSGKWQVASIVYFAIVFIFNNFTRSATVSFISQELFILFFLLASEHVWSKREINLMLNVLTVACALQALIVLLSNSLLLHAGSHQHLQYINTVVNRNSVAFALVPGAIASLLKLVYSEDSLRLFIMRPFWILVFLLCSYDVFAIGCRSAFYALCLGIGVLIWERVRKSKSPAEKLIKELLLAIIIIIVIRGLIVIASGSYSERLFRWEDSGRDILWDKALEMIRQKPLFGGGYDYWESSGMSLGTHNTFISFMLVGGVLACFFLVGYLISFLFEIIKTNSFIPMAFFMEAFLHMCSESTMDYYAYIPLIFSVILVKYFAYQGTIQDLFAN